MTNRFHPLLKPNMRMISKRIPLKTTFLQAGH